MLDLDTVELELEGREVVIEDNSTHRVHVLTLSVDDDVSDAHMIAKIEWDMDDGEVLHLWVSADYQRRGLATRLWRAAQPRGARHSAARTKDGERWARSLGEALPTLDPM